MPIPTSQREFERGSRYLIDAAEALVISPMPPSCHFRFGSCVTNALSEYDSAELYER
jgi:hypothetical protein